jgi:4-hydroxythreonine-4-phosphate dehydrogenase
MSHPPLALTMGEPAGIGGEISLKAWHVLRRDTCPFFVIDDLSRLQGLAAAIGLETPLKQIKNPGEANALFQDALPILSIGETIRCEPGKPGPETAGAVMSAIRHAVELTMLGEAGGVVTNPIQKSVLAEAGFAHPGHTEFLAELAGGGSRSVMMLAGGGLRVVPVTVHMPLSEVPRALTSDLIIETAMITEQALRHDFGIEKPRLALAGLNPHAGENGMLGPEDGAVIRPAVEQLRNAGLNVTGPLPGDTMFHEAARATYDVALCMYHDQALIPLKTLAFDSGVNTTLGLPFVRTSPDHGTALDIAGSGKASATSLIAALRLATEMAQQRRGHG